MKTTVKFIVLLVLIGAAARSWAVDATITFTDNSTNELGFRVERSLNGGAYAPLSTLGPNITQMIDTTLIQSTTGDNKYCYRVLAFNAAGDSAYANTATPGTTDCRLVPMLITIPANPSGLLVK